MAKELILLSKKKYEELMASQSLDGQEMSTQDNQNEMKEIKKPPEQVFVDQFTQTGKGMFVEKTEDFEGTPGILDRPPKKARQRKNNVKWIPY